MVSFPTPNSGPVTVYGGNTFNLAPGNHGNVNIYASGTLALGSGVYRFESLTLEPSSRVVLDQHSGPVVILVRSGLTVRGSITAQGGQFPQLLIATFGSAEASIETPFAGYIVAPNASIRLATVGDPGHRGAFFGKQVEVLANTRVTYVAPPAFDALLGL